MTARGAILDRMLTKLARANMRFRLYTPRIREYCLIVGAMKSGTTSLYAYLVQHPEIAPNRFRKEPEHFSTAVPPDDVCAYNRQWLPVPFRERIALEASTGYSKYPSFPNVAERLKVLPGRKRFLYILRDPVNRIESHLAHNERRGFNALSGADLEESLKHNIATSRYAAQLDLYRTAFPDEPVKVLLFEKFQENPISTVREACEHLGIDPDFNFRRLPPQNTRPATQSVAILSHDQRRELRCLLASDIARLRDEYGVDVSVWGRETA